MTARELIRELSKLPNLDKPVKMMHWVNDDKAQDVESVVNKPQVILLSWI